MTGPLVKLTDRFVETAIDVETIVMDLNSAEFFSLNETAGAIWRAIDGTRDRQAVAAEVAAEFGQDLAEVSGEIDALLDELIGAGFIGGG